MEYVAVGTGSGGLLKANFVWLPAGAAATELAAGLQRAGVMTRCIADHGVRVTIGVAENNAQTPRSKLPQLESELSGVLTSGLRTAANEAR